MLRIIAQQRHNLQLKTEMYCGIRGTKNKGKTKNLLLPLIEVFTKVRGQQAADAVVWKKHVKVT